MFKLHFSKYSYLNFLSFSSAAGGGMRLQKGRSGELHAFLLPNQSPQIAHSQPRAISDCNGEKSLQGWSNGKYLTLTSRWENVGQSLRHTGTAWPCTIQGILCWLYHEVVATTDQEPG